MSRHNTISYVSIILGGLILIIASAAIYLAYNQPQAPSRDDSVVSYTTVTAEASTFARLAPSEATQGTEASLDSLSEDPTQSPPVRSTRTRQELQSSSTADSAAKAPGATSASATQGTTEPKSSQPGKIVEKSSASTAPTSVATRVTRKKGVGYNVVSYTLPLTSLGWVYSWNSLPGGQLTDEVEYVPML